MTNSLTPVWPDFGLNCRKVNQFSAHSNESSKANYQASIQFLAIIGPPAKRHLNGVLLAGR